MQIDWDEYYKSFAAEHGDEPIIYGQDRDTGKGGFLLFPDGWRYNLTTNSEYQPPKNEDAHRTLMQHYWKIRQAILGQLLSDSIDKVRSLINTQMGLSVPLQIATVVETEDDWGRRRRERVVSEVDFDNMLEMCADLREEIQRCKRMETTVTIPEKRVVLFNPVPVLEVLERLEQGDG